ncbi:NADPH-dependent FMN reductase [Actinosynnema sp. ALI-1.44]|uniref:NADPH-dependent FMN reductase n=1 Tax=Actinosynnema sp. ALI-1.44 TaxID=1933779 RepID=UPI00097BF24D|nr:NAD(P)H-dependent oxidoreductase [Actinosynnema sp. ALI-1.44]ONI90811.1 NADPH-dependent FMN reductase [Actinosynnema sp. ALI-1.44]
MTNERIRIAVIIGSTRKGRFGPTVAAWFVEQTERHADLAVDVIDLADAKLPETLSDFGDEPGPEVAAVASRLAAADAFVVVTPEYNHSFPASLKSAIDWHSKEWHAKPIGFVSYGGMAGGLRAVEHLRQVFAELHAVTIRDTVSFHGAWSQFEPDGQAKAPEECNAAAKSMLDQLIWWGHALRDARAKRPYRT